MLRDVGQVVLRDGRDVSRRADAVVDFIEVLEMFLPLRGEDALPSQPLQRDVKAAESANRSMNLKAVMLILLVDRSATRVALATPCARGA